MPITIVLASNPPLPREKKLPTKSEVDLLKRACPQECNEDTIPIIGSFSSLQKEDNILPSSGSFVRGAIEAWGSHLHLVIRPEDVWFAILVQMNFYMTKNAEKIRHIFVSHEEKEEIFCEGEELEQVLGQFSGEIQRRVKTEWLSKWIMPDFSTTTDDDCMTANILMMGLMQQFFSYDMGITCGLPSITLQGGREDWVKLLDRLERLPDFGEEPAAYGRMLRPILSRFVQSFDEPRSPSIVKFWNQIVFARPCNVCGAPPYIFSGWLMGFFYWNSLGQPRFQYNPGELVLDGQRYPALGNTDIPLSYAKVPITIRNFAGQQRYPALAIAGGISKRISPGPPESYEAAAEKAIIITEEVSPEIIIMGDKPGIPKHPETSWSPLNCFLLLLPKSLSKRRQKKNRLQAATIQTTSPQATFTVATSRTLNQTPPHEQGTLQPMTGWALFGPEKKGGPDYDWELDELGFVASKAISWERDYRKRV